MTKKTYIPLCGAVAATTVAASAVVSTPLALGQDVFVNGDIVYFQDMKEFEPREWEDGTLHGGMSQLATVLTDLETTEGEPLVAVGGDVASGTLFNSVYRGMPYVDAFNDLGVDVANFGNHDFDFGADYTAKLVERAQFPWISTNLQNTDGTPFSPDGTTFVDTSGDLKVGFVALTTDLDRTPAARDVIVGDLVEHARKGVTEVQTQDVDVIVLLTQISRDDTHAVMEAVPELDVALREENGAQTPAEHSRTTDGRWIIAPEADYGTVKHLGVTVNRTTDEVTVEPTSINLDGTIAKDPEWQKKSDDYYTELNAQLAEPLGTASEDLDRAELGQMVAQSYREHFKTDFGLQNGGGQRADIAAGPITMRDARAVLPYGNAVTAVEATGEQIKLVLEQGIRSNPDGGNGFPRTAGLTFEFDREAPFGERVTSITMENGQPLEMDKTYTVAVSRFIADGGDGIDGFLDVPRITDETLIDVDAFANYIRNHETVPVVAGEEPEGEKPAEGSSLSSDPVALGVLAAVLGVLAAVGAVLVTSGSQVMDQIMAMLPKF